MKKTMEFDTFYTCGKGADCGSHYIDVKLVYESIDVDGQEFDAKLFITSAGIARNDLSDYVSELLEDSAPLFTGYDYDFDIGRKGRVAKMTFKPVDGFEPHDPRLEPEFWEDR